VQYRVLNAITAVVSRMASRGSRLKIWHAHREKALWLSCRDEPAPGRGRNSFKLELDRRLTLPAMPMRPRRIRQGTQRFAPVNGKDVRALPFFERKRRPPTHHAENRTPSYTSMTSRSAAAICFAPRACVTLEGIVGKWAYATYQTDGRSTRGASGSAPGHYERRPLQLRLVLER
jgi:hypothetical protein